MALIKMEIGHIYSISFGENVRLIGRYQGSNCTSHFFSHSYIIGMDMRIILMVVLVLVVVSQIYEKLQNGRSIA
jgi:hypothetical protein